MPGGLLSLISGRLLLCALVLALPAYFQTIAWFQPIDQRLQLRGVNAGWTFVLESPQSLFLEVALTVREAHSSQSRVVFELNGSRLSEVTPTRLYVAERFRVLLPTATTRPGENRLAVQLADSQASTFELEARLHNYYGTNPKFPRAFIVSDDAVAYWFGQQSLLQHAVRLSACYLASVMLLVVLAWIPRPVSAWRSSVLLVSPSIILWIALLFGLATPLHMWLTIESVLVLSIVPGVLVTVALSLRWRSGLITEIVGVTAVTCVLFELSLRAFNHFRPSWVFYSASYDRFRGQARAPFYDRQLNSKGFNDVEHTLVKGADVDSRILAIGDSFVFGVVPYRANFLTRLEDELRGTIRAEVVKMGIAAADPQDYLSLLVNEGLAFRPNLVVVAFFIGNDFESPARKLYEYSYVATLVRSVATIWRDAPPAQSLPNWSGATYDDEHPSLDEDRFLEIEVDRAWVYETDSTRLQTATAKAVGYLRQMREVSSRAGADLMVVLIPDESQVDPTLQDQVVRARRWASGQFDFRLPNRLLAGALTEEGIRHLDLLAAFEEKSRLTRLYKPRDTHWNIEGNRLAAEEIARFIRESPLGK
jgi:hypothetical protein